jgi:hypothetical protein
MKERNPLKSIRSRSLSGRQVDQKSVKNPRCGVRFARFILMLFISILVLSVVSAKDANAVTNFSWKTGYYVGTGATLSITGLGFQPQMMIIKSDTQGDIGARWKTSSMPANTTVSLIGAAVNTSTELQFDADGFTLSTSTNVNTSGLRYTWMAWGGSDCTSNGTFCVNTYVGDGVNGHAITTPGFQPDLVMVSKGDTALVPFRTSSMNADEGHYFKNNAGNAGGGLFKTLDATGFTVGNYSGVNTNGTTYYFAALKKITNIMDVGTFTGDGLDDKNISTSFTPQAVWLKSVSTTSAKDAMLSTSDFNGDWSAHFNDYSNAATNDIQSLSTNQFQVGTAAEVNTLNDAYHYIIWGGNTISGSGTFNFSTGSYSGTGVAQSVTGIGFRPDVVIIKHTDQATDQYAVFATKMMPPNTTAYFSNGAANFAGGITSLDSGGFTVGTGATVNTSGDTYYWQAFGNAWDPLDNAGAADFALGMYTGNGIDSRNITNTPFTPELVTVKANSSGAGIWRTSSMGADAASYFGATADGTDIIQALNSNGFQVGTNATVNTSGTLYHWFAFDAGTNMVVNSYTGNGGTGTSITGPGLQSDLVWVKRTTAVAGVFRPSSLTGDSSQYFANSPNVAGRIASLNSTGFTVSNNTETNTNTASYWYAAWHGKKYNQTAFRFFANADSADVGAVMGDTNANVTLSATGDDFRLRILNNVTYGNLFASGGLFKLQYVGKGSGTCASPSGGTPASYTDVATDTLISYKNNGSVADGANLTANANDPTDGNTVVVETYEEANDITNSRTAITIGQSGMWDFALYDNGAASATAYCFRLATSGGTALDTYTQRPQITTAAGGTLSVDIVDADGVTVGSPSVTFSEKSFSYSAQTSTATLGISSQKIRVSNTTGTATWTLSIAATSGPTTAWTDGGSNTYDFNDSNTDGADDADADSVGGRLTVDPSGGSISAVAPCASTTGVSPGSSNSFKEVATAVTSITLLSASGSASTNCGWDFITTSLSQLIPGAQKSATFTLSFTITVA